MPESSKRRSTVRTGAAFCIACFAEQFGMLEFDAAECIVEAGRLHAGETIRSWAGLSRAEAVRGASSRSSLGGRAGRE